MVDHGDAYPRSVVLNKENGSAYREVDLFKIPGSTGANCTGVSIGGFEVSSANYLVAINSIDHSLVKNYTSFEMQGLSIDQRDIIICTVPRDELDQLEVRQITLAKYVGSSKIASIPQLVKISEDNFMVLWQEFDKKSNKPGAVKYVFVDGNGEAASEVRSVAYFRLSSCQPMVLEDAVMWYTNENNLRYFYTIPLDA
ncbi:MAG TPA: hypothetical protein VHS59_01425 [Bacillota bacterium]|nr:hypothetical protein [Bacillota bacterium]